MLAFPMIFLFLFGFMLRDAGAAKTDIALVGKVPFVNSMRAQAKTQFDEIFTTTQASDKQAALDKVRKGDLDAVVEQQGTPSRSTTQRPTRWWRPTSTARCPVSSRA